MNQILRNLVRPLYRAFARTPVYREIVQRVAAESWESYIIQDFVQSAYGEAYGITKTGRAQLVDAFGRNARDIQSGTSSIYHTVLAREILEIPPDVGGDVIECGCWKGASAASLSLVCRMVGRRLLVCDSFQGLPDEGLRLLVAPHFGIYGYCKEGMYCGKLEEVKENIRKVGALEACEFVPGFFSESLKALSRSVVFAFLDVDLVSSTQDCLRYIWPLLVEGGKIYTDDAGDLDVVRVFFDEAWWQENLHCSSPGYVGSGCGLPMNFKYSSLGYTRKLSEFNPEMWRRASHLYYPDE